MRFRTGDVQDLFERGPVSRLAHGYSVYAARGWRRRACPRTRSWSEQLAVGEGADAYCIPRSTAAGDRDATAVVTVMN